MSKVDCVTIYFQGLSPLDGQAGMIQLGLQSREQEVAGRHCRQPRPYGLVVPAWAMIQAQPRYDLVPGSLFDPEFEIAGMDLEISGKNALVLVCVEGTGYCRRWGRARVISVYSKLEQVQVEIEWQVAPSGNKPTHLTSVVQKEGRSLGLLEAGFLAKEALVNHRSVSQSHRRLNVIRVLVRFLRSSD